MAASLLLQDQWTNHFLLRIVQGVYFTEILLYTVHATIPVYLHPVSELRIIFRSLNLFLQKLLQKLKVMQCLMFTNHDKDSYL